MIKSKNTKGFTLVELIIVITILAILATIAFISFQSYSADARDTKRKSSIANIVKAIELKTVQWVSLLSVVDTTANTGSYFTWWVLKIAWTWVIQGTDYNAWDVALSTLGLNDSFKDDTKSFKVWASTKAGWVYQVAWKMEASSVAYVLWTYKQRGTWSWVWFFKIWDYVSASTTVSWISSDLRTLTLSSWSTVSATWISLYAAEWTWLILSTTANTPVVDWLANVPY